MKFSRKALTSPKNLFSPSFFWLWHEKLDFSELKQQIDDMHAHGIRALCPHPFPKAFRPGKWPSDMEPDYLTPDFMKVVSQVMDYAQSLGMHVWLYDEGGWPSGGACGQVIAEHPERFCQKTLGLDERENLVLRKTEYHPEQTAPYPSVIEPGATETFLRLTHEQYRKALRKHLGMTARMTFTDEPNMTACVDGEMLSWCSDFAEEFEKRKGYDIRPFLKDVLKAGANPSRRLQAVRVDYFDVRADLFLERYLLPIRDWCHANRMLSGGHLNGENQPVGNTRYGYGHILRALRALDVPGIDVIWRQLYPARERLPYVQQGSMDLPTEVNRMNACFPKYASSAAHQNGTPYVMSESLAVYGDGTTPQVIKWLVDYQLVRGINIFVLSAYSRAVTGWRLGLPGIHFGPCHPYWDFMRPLFTYVERVGSMLAQGRPEVQTAVLYDVRAIWAGGTDARKAIRRHHRIAKLLLEHCCDFDFVDDDQIAKAAVLRGNRLRIGKMSYAAIVLPTSKWLKPAARRKLERFRRQGGIVLTEEREILEKAPRTCFVQGDQGAIRATKRSFDGKSLYFLVNESLRTVKVHVAFEERGRVSLCTPDDGALSPVASIDGKFQWTFSAAGSALFLVEAEKPECHVSSPCFKTRRLLQSGWTLQAIRRYSIGLNGLEVDNHLAAPEVPVRLGDWRPLLGAEFSGTAVYRLHFHVRGKFTAMLDLGKVHHCASVRFNGKALPLKFFAPHQYLVQVKNGSNDLEVTVSNSPLNATSSPATRKFIREHFPPESPYEKCFGAFSHDDQSSGLFGPVALKTIAET